VPPHDAPAGPAVGALYDDAPCGLLLTRPDGTIAVVNRTFCRWIGAEPGTLVGRRFQDLLTVGGRIFHQTHFLPLLHIQGSISEVKLDLVGAPGSAPVPIMVNAIRRTHDGETHDEIAVFIAKERHIYERELMNARRGAEELAERQLETQRALQQADQRKDEFLAMLAHELRNPLAPISTSAHLLRSASQDAMQVRRIADVIARQIGHLTDLVDDLLDVSRVTRGVIQLQMGPVDLAEALTAAIEQARPLIDARGHELDTDLPPGLVFEGDRTRLVQIFANLLTNAAKYTAPGGRIRLSLEQVDGQMRIQVEDNGMGIDDALLPHVFDLFSQADRTPDRSQGGLGIGLALVRNLAALHGGRVEARSEGPGRGSCFTVWLPAASQAPSGATGRPAEARQAPAADRQSLRVLVVDDNADAAETLAEVIRLDGHEAFAATSATAALEHVRLAAPDACIFDIGLPDMSGYTLAERVRELLPQQRPLLVALTGYGQAQERARSKAAGFDVHLVKPAPAMEILVLLREHDRHRRQTAG
jgi:signal transduction histidine kinase/ActR/RegA family two-component response regulator